MTNPRKLYAVVAVLFVFACLLSAADQAKPPRALELKDMLAWKSIRSVNVSNDGNWMAYQLAPTEGDAEVILRSTHGDKETRFPIGELPRGGGRPGPEAMMGGPAPGASVGFSDDSKWLAFLAYPTEKEARTLRRTRRPAQSKVVLVNIATGEKTEFDKMRRFAFSGETPGWIALQRYGAEAPGGAAPSAAPAAPGAGARGGAAPASRPQGSDLILRELASGEEINIGNVGEFAFNKGGQWLAWTIDAAEKAGNGVDVRNMATGTVRALDSGKAVYRRLTWTEKGDAFAALKGVEDKKFQNERYSLVAFSDLSNSQPRKVVYDPASDSSFPADMTISQNRSPQWNISLDAVYFGIHELKKKEDQPGNGAGGPRAEGATAEGAPPQQAQDTEDKADVVIWNWQDTRLQSQQQVQENMDKNFSYACEYRVGEKKFIRLADEKLRRVNVSPESRYAVGTDNKEYELQGNLDGRNYQDVYVIDLKTGERTLALKKARWFSGTSEDGSRLLYYDDGNYFVYDAATRESRNITKGVKASFVDVEDDHNVTKPPVRPIGWVKGDKSVLLSDAWDIWNVPVDGGQAVNLTVDGKANRIRYQRPFRLDPEEHQIPLDKPLYLTAMAEQTKQGGMVHIEPGKPGAKRLLWGDSGNATLLKAKKAETYLYTAEDFEKYPNFNVAGADLKDGRQITDANPQQKEFLWSKGAKLIDYVSAKGDKLQAALFLPGNYEPGKSYPTVVYIYEKLTQGLNRYTAPALPGGGFNKTFYTSNGYAVLMPDIVYKVNDPGMSALWCVVPAVKAAIATGVVDKDRVAIHGHSWGGYQTAFLVTQTDVFKAAIAGAPLTNMISMYSSIYWNTGSANQPIFESSQGRFSADPSELPEAYERNSPVYFARNVKTPLVILHNDKDGAVDWNQGVTYYNSLRRLGKKVVMLQYKGENHGLAKPANQKDYTARMKEFFDYYLMDKPAPKWWSQGIDYLKIDDELKARNPKPPAPAGPAAKKAAPEQQ